MNTTSPAATNARPFAPGFRLSALDVVILVVGAVAAASISLAVDRMLGVAIAFVVGHFFLFCNVLRMSRPLELTWAAAFAGLAVGCTAGVASWAIAFAGAGGLTVILAIAAIRQPSYHGVGWRAVNPKLPEWWAARAGSVA